MAWARQMLLVMTREPQPMLVPRAMAHAPAGVRWGDKFSFLFVHKEVPFFQESRNRINMKE